MTDIAPAYAIAVDQLRARAEAAEKERDALRAQLEAVTAERDAARARLEEWQATARFAHEDHPGVAQLRAELDGTRARLTMTTRDLDAAERTISTLKAIMHAAVNAVAKETP